jgi:hypothetical protein
VTYEGSRFAVTELRLLMDTFTQVAFTGSWQHLFSKVRKHIIWSVLKSVTGMQGKKFKDKLPATGQTDEGYPDSDSSSDSTTSSHVAPGEQFLRARWHQSERAGERFVSSIRGLFNSQHRRARSMLRTMREPKEEEEEDVEQLDKDNSSEDDDRRMVVPKKLRHRGRSSSKSRPTTISHKIHHSSHPKGSASYIFGNCFLL